MTDTQLVRELRNRTILAYKGDIPLEEAEGLEVELLCRLGAAHPTSGDTAKCPKCGIAMPVEEVWRIGEDPESIDYHAVRCANGHETKLPVHLSLADFAQFFTGATDRLPEALSDLLNAIEEMKPFITNRDHIPWNNVVHCAAALSGERK